MSSYNKFKTNPHLKPSQQVVFFNAQQTTKYAFAERLGNYIDPELELSGPLKKLQKRFFDEKLMEKYASKYEYEYMCKKNVDLAPESCEVVFNN